MKTKSIFIYCFSLTLLIFTCFSQAIIRRHDLSEQDYIMTESSYPNIMRWSGCSAALIGEQWILTAAHCVLGYDGKGRETDSFVEINGAQYDLDGDPITHPEYRSINRVDYAERLWDIALLKLQQPVLNVAPLGLYEANSELGQAVEIWGFGKSGDGLTGKDSASPDFLRRGTNRIYRLSNHELFLKFTSPHELDATQFEAHIGNGDSGGPLIIETQGNRLVAGVGSTAHQNGGDMFKYGSDSIYERVSANLGWLKLEMGEDYPGSYDGPLYQQPDDNTDSPQTESDSGGGGLEPSLIFFMILICFCYLPRSQRLIRK